MLGRASWCVLAGIFLASGLLAGQNKSDEPGVRLTTPRRVLPVERFPSPPVRLPILRSPIATQPGAFGFPQLARAAGMIFVGSVVRVQRVPASRGQAIETLAITFHVENGIRGVAAGDLTVTQWTGLWSSGQRYRVGERMLFFLYPSSKLGLTSWVGGPLGRFALDSSGHVLMTAQQMAAFRRDSVLGGKSRLPLSDFALAVRRSGEEE